MSIVKYRDKRSGVTYAYNSESYWDKEKKQPRSKRTLIGKIDEETGEIVPTGKSGRKKPAAEDPAGHTAGGPITAQVKLLALKDDQIRSLKSENAALRKEKQEAIRELEALLKKLAD